MKNLQHQIIREHSPPLFLLKQLHSLINIQMKKVIILATLVLGFSLSSLSQLTKGNWLIGGDVKFASTKLNSELGQKNTYYNCEIAPNVGYFLINKLAVGLKTNITLSGGKATGTTIYSTNTDYNFGPFVRYYFLQAESQYNILAEGVYQYGFVEGGTSKNTFTFAAGPVIYFNTSAGLEFLVGYSSYKYSGFVGRNNTIQIGLGLQFYLEKNK